jgi:hypothetical protein
MRRTNERSGPAAMESGTVDTLAFIEQRQGSTFVVITNEVYTEKEYGATGFALMIAISSSAKRIRIACVPSCPL